MSRKLFGMISSKYSLPYTEQALNSFFENTKLSENDRFILIDNDNSYNLDGSSKPSEDNTFPIELIKNNNPKGFAENGNFFIEQALELEADLFFLNNDIIFTKDWLSPLEVETDSLLSPLSNREVQYVSSVVVQTTSKIMSMFVCANPMQLEQYQGNEAALAAISEAHQKNTQGYWPVYVAPFFAIKMPLNILKQLGFFDTSFGKAGGEDFDYCLRAYLAGFEVRYALQSYLLHFGGKSSWGGAETVAEQTEREKFFRNRFREKWGAKLHDMILLEDKNIFLDNPQIKAEDSQGQLRKVIESLLEGPAPSVKI